MNGFSFDTISLVIIVILCIYVLMKFVSSIRIVQTRKAMVVERLGKYSRTLSPGFHILIPFVDQVTYHHDLREEAINVDPQECFTMDNVKVEVDGVIYVSVSDAVKASYGIDNYRFGVIQLAQTTTRSVIGLMDLDKTFEEREIISAKVVSELGEAGKNWGITVHRYEVKNITPPTTVKNAMERQMSAEREKRAVIARSEGHMQAVINESEGKANELINMSEGEKQKLINEAEGKANEIWALAEATAESVEKVAAAISLKGGKDAVEMKLTQTLINKYAQIGKEGNTVILPTNLADIDEVIGRIKL